MAETTWLLGVVIGVSVVIGILLIILGVLVFYCCYWRRREQDTIYKRTVVEGDTTSISSVDSTKVRQPKTQMPIYIQHEKAPNAFFTMPATRSLTNLRYSDNPRGIPGGRYKYKEASKARKAYSDIHNYKSQSLDARSVKLHVHNLGVRPNPHEVTHYRMEDVHTMNDGIVGPSFGQENTGFSDNHTVTVAVDGMTARDESLMRNPGQHTYYVGGGTQVTERAHTSRGGFSSSTLQSNKMHVDNNIQGRVSPIQIDSHTQEIQVIDTLQRGEIQMSELQYNGPVLTSNRVVSTETISPDSPRSIITLPSGSMPTWNTGQSESTGSRISGPLLTTEQQNDAIEHRLPVTDPDVLW